MGYATLELAREFTGIPNDITEDDVVNILASADKYIQADIAVRVRHEEPYGEVDADNKIYYLSNFPVADTNFDSTVDADDVEVYFWSDSVDFGTRELQASSGYTIDGNTGEITFTTAPDTDKITVNYSYYKNEVDFSLVKTAASIIAAAFYSMREYSLLPSEYGLGMVRTRRRIEPCDHLFEQYERIKMRIITRPYATTKVEDQPEADVDAKKIRLKWRE